MTGTLSFHSGLSAEGAVAEDYVRRGFRVVARRWRGQGGEIDLIVENAQAGTVFVEVKAARSREAALQRVLPCQIARILRTAEEYLGLAGGIDRLSRVDVALVDRMGRVDILENAAF